MSFSPGCGKRSGLGAGMEIEHGWIVSIGAVCWRGGAECVCLSARVCGCDGVGQASAMWAVFTGSVMLKVWEFAPRTQIAVACEQSEACPSLQSGPPALVLLSKPCPWAGITFQVAHCLLCSTHGPALKHVLYACMYLYVVCGLSVSLSRQSQNGWSNVWRISLVVVVV